MKNLILLLVIILVQLNGQAQVSKGNPPKIIFMKLEESVNKIEAMKKRGMAQSDIQSVMDADREINSSMINDFKNNFKFCVVYFFYAKDLEKLVEKRFSEIEFYDAEHFKLKKKIAIENADDYLIAELGYQPIIENINITNQKVALKNFDYDGSQDHVGSRDYGILLFDETHKLLKDPYIHWVNVSMRRVGNIFKPSTLKYTFSGSINLEKKLRKYYLEP